MELVPRTVGELLSDGVTLLRRHLGRFVLVALPFCAIELVMRDALFSLFPLLTRNLQPDTPLDVALPSVLQALFAGGSLSLLLAVVSWLLTIAATMVASGALFGQRLEPRAVLRGTLRHTGRVFVTAVLWFCALLVVGLVLPTLAVIAVAVLSGSPALVLVAAALALVWLVVVVISLGLRWALWPQLIALENLSPLKALRRSARLMGPDGVSLLQNPKFRLSLLLLVYFAVQSAVQQLFLAPTIVQGLGQTPPFSGDTSLWSLPLYFGVPLALLQVLSNSVLLPLSGVLTTLFYFDVRVRYEGLDLEVGAGEPAA